MKIKTSKLEGAALDWAVAIAGGADVFISDGLPSVSVFSEQHGDFFLEPYEPSIDWSQGGPLLAEYATHAEKYPLAKHEPWVVWVANDEPGQCGDTLLIAAMRAIVAAELGDTVDVPEELAP